MKTLRLLTMILAATMLIGAAQVLAATDTKNLTINASVQGKAKLTLLTYTINFPDQDPDTVPSIPASENSVAVEVKARTSSGSTVTLTVLANGANLVAGGGETIAISNVTWTAAGGGFVPGTMNSVTPQSAGSWSGSGTHSSTFEYFLANSWDYLAGSYTQTATYTLTAP